jgi:heptosyltransferase II
MGYATGAKERIGFKKELRNALLTSAFDKPKNLHRVEEYIALVNRGAVQSNVSFRVQLHHSFPKKNYVVVNINSEAFSRRLTTAKAVALLTKLRAAIKETIVLIGGPKEAAFVASVMQLLPSREGVESIAGKTNLEELVEVLASAAVMLTTDSGPAHLANALGTHTIVLFGAGNENNTAPWNESLRTITRLGKLTCEPCVRNECVQFPTPQCLELLDDELIVQTLQKRLHHG